MRGLEAASEPSYVSAADCLPDHRCGPAALRARGRAMLSPLRTTHRWTTTPPPLFFQLRPHPRAGGAARRPRHRPEDDQPACSRTPRSPSSRPRRKASTTPACRSRIPTCICGASPRRCGASWRWSAEPPSARRGGPSDGSPSRSRRRALTRRSPRTRRMPASDPEVTHADRSRQLAGGHAAAPRDPMPPSRGLPPRFGSKPPAADSASSRTCARCSGCASRCSPEKAAPA